MNLCCHFFNSYFPSIYPCRRHDLPPTLEIIPRNLSKISTTKNCNFYYQNYHFGQWKDIFFYEGFPNYPHKKRCECQMVEHWVHAGTRPSGQVLNLYNIVVKFCLCHNTDSYSDTENLTPGGWCWSAGLYTMFARGGRFPSIRRCIVERVQTILSFSDQDSVANSKFFVECSPTKPLSLSEDFASIHHCIVLLSSRECCQL